MLPNDDSTLYLTLDGVDNGVVIDSAEILDQKPSEVPPKRSWKQIVLKVALYLAPFAYSLILLKWGSSFSALWIILFACFVVVLLILAVGLHFKEIVAGKSLKSYIHDHLLFSISTIVIVCCLIVGTVVYLAVRPPHEKTDVNKSASHSAAGAQTQAFPVKSTSTASELPQPEILIKKKRRINAGGRSIPLASSANPQSATTAPIATPIITGSITQSTNAPCSGNSVTGNVDNSGCGTPNPYKPVITYKPHGLRTTVTPGEISADGDAVEVYKQFYEASLRQDWSRVLAITDNAKKKFPGWYMPYGFSGDAHAQLCETKLAQADLSKFINDTEGIEDYATDRKNAQMDLADINSPAYLARCGGN